MLGNGKRGSASNKGFLKRGIPRRHRGCFKTNSWSSMTWMIWGYTHFIGHLQNLENSWDITKDEWYIDREKLCLHMLDCLTCLLLFIHYGQSHEPSSITFWPPECFGGRAGDVRPENIRKTVWRQLEPLTKSWLIRYDREVYYWEWQEPPTRSNQSI